mgnify:CR=1 FL=1|jgi:hypothetical protein
MTQHEFGEDSAVTNLYVVAIRVPQKDLVDDVLFVGSGHWDINLKIDLRLHIPKFLHDAVDVIWFQSYVRHNKIISISYPWHSFDEMQLYVT